MVRTGDYSLGKIYKIVSDQTDDIYIGSTCQKLLSMRLAGHKLSYARWLGGKHNYISSFEILKYDDCKIILIESYPCNDKNELLSRERYWVENTKCINKNVPSRSKKNIALIIEKKH